MILFDLHIDGTRVWVVWKAVVELVLGSAVALLARLPALPSGLTLWPCGLEPKPLPHMQPVLRGIAVPPANRRTSHFCTETCAGRARPALAAKQ